MNRILSIFMVDEHVHLLKLKKKVKGHKVVDQPILGADDETLANACRWADDIYICKDFPSAVHGFGRFPSQKKAGLKFVVKNTVRKYLDIPDTEDLRVAFTVLEKTVEAEVPIYQVAYLAVPNSEFLEIEKKVYADYKTKIKHITSLPSAICAAVVEAKKPGDDFMVILVQEYATIIAIASPAGDVKVARQTPLVFSRQELIDNPQRVPELIEEIGDDIRSTLLYYSQYSESSTCTRLYLIGPQEMIEGLRALPLSGFTEISQLTSQDAASFGLQDVEINDVAHLIGCVHSSKQKKVGFVDSNILIERWIDRGFQMAIAGTSVAVLLSGLHFMRMEPLNPTKLNQHQENNFFIRRLNNENAKIRNEINELAQFQGWESFYVNTYKNQPDWIGLFRDITRFIPEEIVLDSFQITPQTRGKFYQWNGILKGRIQTSHWEDGLETIRDFGARLHNEPNYRIIDLDYSPKSEALTGESKKNIRAETLGFSKTNQLHFQYKMIINPEDYSNESS